MFRAHPDAVARVDDQELSVQRLGELMVLGQPLPLEEDVAREMAGHWINVTAFASRLAAGDSLWSDAFVRDAMWLNIRRLAINRWRDRIAAEGLVISPSAVDSAYRVGEHRIVAHILRAVPPNASREQRQEQRDTAQRIRDQLIAGLAWEEANLQNQDSLTRDAIGSLGVTSRGTFVPRFENVAYELRPGGLSNVVETQAGYHIIFRPELESVREPFSAFVSQTLRARFDSTYQESVLRSHEVEFSQRAPRSMRDIATTPFASHNAARTIANYTDGTLTEHRAAQYVRLLPAPTHNEMKSAEDDELIRFTRGLVLEEILWRKADSAGLQVSDSTIALLVRNYRADLSRLWNQLGLSPDSVLAVPDGHTAASHASTLVDRYFEAAVSRRIPLQPLPTFLVAKLRESVRWSIETSGITATVELARRLQAGADNR